MTAAPDAHPNACPAAGQGQGTGVAAPRLGAMLMCAAVAALMLPAVAAAMGPRTGLAHGPSIASSASASAQAWASAAGSGSSSAPRQQPSGGALLSTIRTLVDAIRPQSDGAFVVPAVLRSDTPAPRGAELTVRYGSLLAGALGPSARAARSSATLDAARSQAASSRTLVYLELEIAAGELRVTADVFPIPHNIWDRTRNRTPGPIGHAFASARLDAEVRAFLAPIPLVALRVTKAGMDENDVVALACDDIDGDGALELLTVSRHNVSIARVRDNKLSVLRRVAWAQLSPISPTPWREPIATAVVSRGAFVDVGSTDRARGLRLDASLQVQATLDGLPVAQPSGDACSRPQIGVMSERLSRCTPSDPAPSAMPDSPFDAWVAARIFARDGSARDVWAVRDPSESRVVLRDNAARSASIRGVGAQIAIADLDQDGDPELISSRDVLAERDDALVVRTWGTSGPPRDRVSVAVPSGISAVAVCPADGPLNRAVVLATRGELWVMR